MRVIEASFRTCLSTLDVRTSQAPQFIDITDRGTEVIADSRVQEGMVCVFSKHMTLATVVQEKEPPLMTDLASFVERLAPRGGHYRHNDCGVRTVNMHENDCPNGHSRCQHLVLRASQTMPIVDGRMALGQWQRIFAVEPNADKAPQIDSRQVDLQVMGI